MTALRLSTFNFSINSFVITVRNKIRALRFCVDFRALDKHVDLPAIPLADQRAILDSMEGAKLFTALDLCCGFLSDPTRRS